RRPPRLPGAERGRRERAEIVMSNHLHRERAERPKGSPKAAPESAAPKASLYEKITARIIADLETGTFPWAQPWGAGPGTPRSDCRETPQPENPIPGSTS